MHNTPGGKLNRGLSVVDTVEILLCTDASGNRTRELTEPEYLKAAILGWCIELVRLRTNLASIRGALSNVQSFHIPYSCKHTSSWQMT